MCVNCRSSNRYHQNQWIMTPFVCKGNRHDGRKMPWLESKRKLYKIFSIIGGRICFLLPSRVGGLYHKSPVLRSRSPMRLTSGVPSSCHRNWGIHSYITYKIIMSSMISVFSLKHLFITTTWIRTFQKSSKTKHLRVFNVVLAGASWSAPFRAPHLGLRFTAFSLALLGGSWYLGIGLKAIMFIKHVAQATIVIYLVTAR